MARFAGLGLEPILADSDDEDGYTGSRRAEFGLRGKDGRRGEKGGGNDAMTDTWQNEFGNIKVNDRGMRVAQRDGQEELLLEGQVVPDQLVFGDGRVIGRGACSVVNLARHKDTGQLFAVKVFSLLDREKRRQLDREIGTLLRSLENGCCSQLVDFFGAFKRPDGSIRVVLEYMDRGSLADVMEYRSSIQSRWNERRDLKLKEERQREARNKKAAAAAAEAAKVTSSPTPGVSNGHLDALFPFSSNNSGGGDIDEEDDDMPATFERLGSRGRGEEHGLVLPAVAVPSSPVSSINNGSSSSNGSNSSSISDSICSNFLHYHNDSSKSKNKNNGYLFHEEGGGGGGSGGGGGGGNGFRSGRLRMASNASSVANLTVEIPAPLSEGACATPGSTLAETVLDRGRGKAGAPWQRVDVDASAEPDSISQENGEDEEEKPEAAERRRVEAATELQRQKEQEEWDRAFEEELVQMGLPEDVVAACVYQILAGLTYLHEHNQLHRDVKPSNILLNARGEVKLTDFGIARELDHAGAMVETVVGTVRYMSPERLQGDAYGRPADVWGLGLVMIECVTQEAPYADGCSQIEILQTLKEHGGSGLLPSGLEDRPPLSEAFVGFVGDCLRVKPEDRLTTAELLNSRWFTEQGVYGQEEAVDLMSEYLEGLYGPHAYKYFADGGTNPDLTPLY